MSLLVGDCIDVMPTFEAERFSAVVCDPPYGLEFMGQEWDAPWKRQITEHSANGLVAPRVGSTRNPVCRTCRRMKRGAEACTCAESDFDETPADEARLFQAWCEVWAREAFRVLKPGGFLLAFGGSRTYHRLTCALEDVGFEIRDSLMWLYGSGFPKSLNVSKAIDEHLGADATQEAADWTGWGTALKPSHEPIVVARKPFRGTVAANVLAHGTAGLNVDASRVAGAAGYSYPNGPGGNTFSVGDDPDGTRSEPVESSPLGRWPANVLLSHDPACALVGEREVRSNGHFPAARGEGGLGTSGHAGQGDLEERRTSGETVEVWDCVAGCPVQMLDEQSGERKAGGNLKGGEPSQPFGGVTYSGMMRSSQPWQGYGDKGGASRFFYCAKVTRAERDAGLDESFEERELSWSNGEQNPGSFQSEDTDRATRNPHPTVKPIDVMRWLLRLVTPPGGEVLDPFLGSGSTACAAALEGIELTGIEQDPEYARIAAARVAYWEEHGEGALERMRARATSERRRELIEDAGQLGLFG